MPQSKKVILVKIEAIYIDNNTLQPVQVPTKELLMDNILGTSKYTFVEVYTPLARFAAKTYKALDAAITAWSEDNSQYDFHSVVY